MTRPRLWASQALPAAQTELAAKVPVRSLARTAKPRISASTRVDRRPFVRFFPCSRSRSAMPCKATVYTIPRAV